MDKCHKQRLQLAKEFKECQKAFVALGDETRHQIITSLLESDTHGIRVGEITKKLISLDLQYHIIYIY